MKKILFFFLFFYILVLVENSFFVHFKLFGGVANLVLLAIILIIFFEKPKATSGIIIAAIGGFYLDLFSDFWIGTSVFLLVILGFLAKKILDLFHQRKVIHFILVFLLIFLGYSIGISVINAVVKSSFHCYLRELSLAGVIYNLILGLFCFYFTKLCFPNVLEK